MLHEIKLRDALGSPLEVQLVNIPLEVFVDIIFFLQTLVLGQIAPRVVTNFKHVALRRYLIEDHQPVILLAGG